MYKCSSVPKQNEQLYKTGSARGDAWLRRISANNLLTLVNASDLSKTLLPRCPIVFELKIGIDLPIRPSNPLFHPSVHDYPPKMYSVLPRV